MAQALAQLLAQGQELGAALRILRQLVVARVLERLRPGGFFFLGHSESLNGVNSSVHPVAPAAYRK